MDSLETYRLHSLGSPVRTYLDRGALATILRTEVKRVATAHVKFLQRVAMNRPFTRPGGLRERTHVCYCYCKRAVFCLPDTPPLDPLALGPSVYCIPFQYREAPSGIELTPRPQHPPLSNTYPLSPPSVLGRFAFWNSGEPTSTTYLR